MQKLFYILFWLLNIILTPITPLLVIFFAGIIAALTEYNKILITNKDTLIIFFILGVIFFYYIFKIFVLPLIYFVSKKNIYIHNFFDKIEKEKYFRKKVLFRALLGDILIILLWLNETIFLNIKNLPEGFIFCYLVSGGGLFASYLSLIIWFKIKK